MSKLEFFCSRPTVVALIGFGFDLSAATYVENDKDVNTVAFEKSDMEKDTNDEGGRIEGLWRPAYRYAGDAAEDLVDHPGRPAAHGGGIGPAEKG